jgi:hypothetical protein
VGPKLQREAGVGVVAILFWIVLVAALFWLGSKLAPLYYEYWNIQTIFQEQIQKGSLYDSAGELERVVIDELEFQDLTRLDANAIKVQKGPGEGRYHIYAKYEAVVPLSERIRLVITFKPEAREGG